MGKTKVFIISPIFDAEDLTDFLNERDKLKIPFFRRRGILDRINDYAGIIIPDVQITYLGEVPNHLVDVAYYPVFNALANIVPPETHYFSLTDGTSEMKVLWTPKTSTVHRPNQTYEEAQSALGLLNKDEISLLRMKFYPKRRYSTIVNVEKDISQDAVEELLEESPELFLV